MDNAQFDQNPFLSILQQKQAAPSGAPQGAPMGMMPDAQPEDNQLMKGKNPDSSQALIGATKMLQNFIADSTDSTDIATARSIIMLIARLIAKQQEKMSGQLPQDEAVMKTMGAGPQSA